MLIKLTSFFTENDIYVNVNRISVIDSCKTDDGSVKTRIACPKPIYVKETPEEILELIHEAQARYMKDVWDATNGVYEMPLRA